MLIYVVKISSRDLNPTFGAWRDEEQAKGFINAVRELQNEDTYEYNEEQLREYFNRVKKYLSNYIANEGKESFIKGWDRADIEQLLDLFIGRAVIIMSYEIHDEFYEQKKIFEKFIK